MSVENKKHWNQDFGIDQNEIIRLLEISQSSEGMALPMPMPEHTMDAEGGEPAKKLPGLDLFGLRFATKYRALQREKRSKGIEVEYVMSRPEMYGDLHTDKKSSFAIITQKPLRLYEIATFEGAFYERLCSQDAPHQDSRYLHSNVFEEIAMSAAWAWEAFIKTDSPSFEIEEGNAFPNILLNDELVATFIFNVREGSSEGAVLYLLPISSLAPIEDSLSHLDESVFDRAFKLYAEES